MITDIIAAVFTNKFQLLLNSLIMIKFIIILKNKPLNYSDSLSNFRQTNLVSVSVYVKTFPISTVQNSAVSALHT